MLDNNLNVVGYSVPVDKEVTLDELKKHLHTMVKTMVWLMLQMVG